MILHRLAIFLMATLTISSIGAQESERIPLVFDTDANNELDDQHALAYLFANQDIFDIRAITVNATTSGGDIMEHVKEADRIMKLCKVDGDIPLLSGANGSFIEIIDEITNEDYDGHEAIEFIIEEAKRHTQKPLFIVAVGKLTNVALAIKKEPTIQDNIKVIWLGSNYPEPHEYNLENDIPSMNYIIEQSVPLEIVVARYGKASGTDAVRVSIDEAYSTLPGLGPTIDTPITGRHGGSFNNFGDYAVNLFEHIPLHGDPPSRALFDMAAVAIIKDPSWATTNEIPAPIMKDKKWVDRPDNNRTILIWENFDKAAIIDDFYESLRRLR